MGAGAVTRAVDVRDALGRVTTHTEYQTNGTTVAYSREATYLKNNLVSQDIVSVADNDTLGAHPVTISTSTYDYKLESSPGSGVWTGTYMGGVATHVATEVHQIGSGGAYNEKPDTDTKTTFAWWDGALALTVTYDNNVGNTSNNPWTTTNSYDVGGHITTAVINDGRDRTVNFVSDDMGQVLTRKETSTATYNPAELYYYFNGVRVGDVG